VRSNDSAARDGVGAASSETSLLCTVVAPAGPTKSSVARFVIGVPGGVAANVAVAMKKAKTKTKDLSLRTPRALRRRRRGREE
jgi:hypothetical protein